MLWHALPPELNTARLMAGAGPAPMLQAASGWTGLATALEAQADELAMQLTTLAAAWTGGAGEQAVAAATPMVAWLRGVSAQAQRRAEQASAQAAAYTAALATTPSLPEIAANHVTRAVLVSTNFLGINTVPIGVKEADYFVRMWNQAAGAMDAYQAETSMNTTFEPLAPRKPILMPGVGEAVQAQTMGVTAQMTAQPAVSDVIADVAARAADPAVTGVADAASGRLSEAASRLPQLMTFMQQTGQMGSPLLQQLSSLLQQSGGATGLGNLGDQGPSQMGLLGAGPMSNHPLAGGAGPTRGGGLLRGGDLPGAGGEPIRTPLLANMIDKYGPALGPAATTVVDAGVGVAGAAAGAGAGASGSGLGGAPMGMAAAHSAAAAASRPGLVVPAMLADDPDASAERPDDDPYEDW
ncbi:PPE family protein [Mycolicibacterium sp. S2-37]|uniref:PPE family protein n=1 Tax=Mycolicibacterium sp. S2-37 TaxID=2810297 RepID=UPI001A93EF1F|nr:PPE family protein [Mycolicibacterium sp. S2-37]MBO0677338.1 PPE family protein [Mycolicibacterium sp. S2-37]